MTNLTLAIDEKKLLEARKVALNRGTSVNALVRGFIDEIASDAADRDAAVKTLEKIWSRTKAKVGRIKWTRDELHER